MTIGPFAIAGADAMGVRVRALCVAALLSGCAAPHLAGDRPAILTPGEINDHADLYDRQTAFVRGILITKAHPWEMKIVDKGWIRKGSDNGCLVLLSDFLIETEPLFSREKSPREYFNRKKFTIKGIYHKPEGEVSLDGCFVRSFFAVDDDYMRGLYEKAPRRP